MTRQRTLKSQAQQLGSKGLFLYQIAMCDLIMWPGHEKKILDDLEAALQACKEERKETRSCKPTDK